MKRKTVQTAVCVLMFPVMAVLASCGSNYGKAETAGASEDKEYVSVIDEPIPDAETGRQDGERFEEVIILEGMEETVRYEHVRNTALGFEMDYDFESFVRRSEPDRECFISVYDDPEAPENYLEVTFSTEDAGTVSASIGEALSKDYDITRESFPLDHAEGCIRIDASGGTGNTGTPNRLQAVYIIPAPDGSRILTAHYTLESAEGFGRRFAYLANTFVVIDRQAE